MAQQLKTKNEKVAKAVEFMRTHDQCPRGFNFDNYFYFRNPSPLNHPLFAGEK